MSTLLIGALALAIVFRYLYRGLLNPLSHIPGPPLSRWTDIAVSYYWLKGKKTVYVDELHKQYGPVVRIATNEVDICDVGAARAIHRTGGRFMKSEWYRLLIPRPFENVFSTPDPHLHSSRRRLLASPLSDTSLTRFEPQIRHMVQLAISQMSCEMKVKGSVDVFKWWLFMATDIIGELSFGESFRMLENGEKNQYSHDLEYLGSLAPIRTTFPSLIKIGAILPLPIFSKAVQAGTRVHEYARESVARHKSLVAKDSSNAKSTLFTKLDDAGEKGLSEHETCSEARGYIVAGSDTTAVTLTYLVYAVCRDSHIRDRLVSELMSLPEDFTDRHARNLPYLNQVINETLRLYTAVPGVLPRVVPEEGVQLAGFNFPRGTIVSTQAYSMHRDEDIFPEPLTFNPERWAAPTKAMKDASLPFGGGSRSEYLAKTNRFIEVEANNSVRVEKVCLGIHLARIELRLATSLFFRAFPSVKMSTHEGMCDDDMEMASYFLLSPKGHQCLVEL
ncbi:cytochrome P450 [Aspergillus affinis]|uniref:cytochrome P450 n=1 Tax=Aspergillus affinis TaxID=1070780 RepID=UPI0022FEE031|nr:cytochrome P450 [Aspergillus affinis]KAI9042841.1 cytochrome P450 [Aspergillus affinis]